MKAALSLLISGLMITASGFGLWRYNFNSLKYQGGDSYALRGEAIGLALVIFGGAVVIVGLVMFIINRRHSNS